jgi:hypothetical protein
MVYLDTDWRAVDPWKLCELLLQQTLNDVGTPLRIAGNPISEDDRLSKHGVV